MASISRMKAGQYSVSDGRIIVKQGSSWYVLTKSGNNEFGPVTTLNAASQYVNSSSVPIGNILEVRLMDENKVRKNLMPT